MVQAKILIVCILINMAYKAINIGEIKIYTEEGASGRVKLTVYEKGK